MSEFFYGWRRKIGAITLVVACFVMGMWIRSRAINDAIAFPGQQRQHVLFSGKGCVHWLAYSLGGQQPEWDARTNVESEFLFFARMGSDSVEAKFGEWTMPYWLLVVPLALLSASLILWKPSKRDADSTPSEAKSPCAIMLGETQQWTKGWTPWKTPTAQRASRSFSPAQRAGFPTTLNPLEA